MMPEGCNNKRNVSLSLIINKKRNKLRIYINIISMATLGEEHYFGSSDWLMTVNESLHVIGGFLFSLLQLITQTHA